MRKVLPFLVFMAVGCQQCPRFFDCSSACVEKQIVRDCAEDEVVACPPKRVVHRDKPSPIQAPVCVAEENCPQTKSVCKQPETIHIKLPPQKIVVHQQEAAQNAFAQQAMMAQPQAIMAQPQQMMMVPMAQAQAAPAGRARLGFTFDVFRMPIPILRPIAVPDAAPQFQAVPVAMAQAVQPQMVMAQPQMMQHQMVQQVQTHAAVPVQGHAVVPVQGHAVVPVQGQAVVPVQSHAMFSAHSQGAAPAQTHSFAVQSHPVVQPQMQGISLQQAEEFCRLVEQMKKQMNERR